MEPRSLNNFSSLPSFNLKWGRQRQLRCVKHPELSHPDAFRKRRSHSSSSPSSSSDDGVEPGKDKLVLDNMQSDAAVDTADTRPWNLRTRRAVCKDPNNAIGSSPEKISGEFKLAPNKVSCDGERRKFSVALSKAEIVDDFLAMTGARPARRPKKRSRYVQRQIDVVSPGFWLTEITADMYKVEERPIDGGKK